MVTALSIVLIWLLLGGCWGAKQRDKDAQTGTGPADNASLLAASDR
jgi:hypothetical protein